ncbi:MAG: hypothetical protein IJY06_10330 [Oscillospiraceae bacterium]|nr:hypothetical protein [Oscillospiraceae bacterium]
MKKTCITILALLLCLTPMHCSAEEVKEETLTLDGLVYVRKTSDTDDFWLITGCEGTPEDYQLYIPAEIGGVPVRAQEGSFRGFLSVKAFAADPEHAQLCTVDGVLFSKDMTTLYRYPPLREGAYVIPDGVTDAGYAFEDCIRLTTLTIPDSVAEEMHSFGNCRTLTEISGPLCISTGYSVRACSQLRNLHIAVPDTMGMQKFTNLDCNGWEQLETIVIGENCLMKEDFLIRACPALTSIDCSQALAKGEGSDEANVLAENCRSLTRVVLPPVEDPEKWANFEMNQCGAVETVKIYGGWWTSISGSPDAVVYGYQENSYLHSYCEVSGLEFVPFGDVNTDHELSIADVLALNKNLLAGSSLTASGREAADYDGDGTATPADALSILRAVVRL